VQVIHSKLEKPHLTTIVRDIRPTLRAAAGLDRHTLARADRAEIAALRAAPEARFLLLADGKCAIVSSADRSLASIRWFEASALAALGIGNLDLVFLGVDAGSKSGRFAIALPPDLVERHADVLRPLVDLRSLALQGAMSADELSLLAQAKSLADWNETHRFCGKCGTPTNSSDGGWKRICTSCGRDAFPRIDPVVIMLVTDGARCVLARETRFPPGMYSAIAGFIEPGDDLEHAVRRETKEEIGLAVDEVRYELSQPWPFPHSLMLGCFAFTTFKDLTIDSAELEAARWFGRDEAAAMLEGRHTDALTLPGPHAIANTLVRRWLAGV
jgi:NAD+ diphosphatase